MLPSLTWMKINRILKGLVDCEAQFISVHDLEKGGWDPSQLLLLQPLREGAPEPATRPRYLINESGSSIGFPLFIEEEFVGLAVLVGSLKRIMPQLDSVAVLLTSVLEKALERDFSAVGIEDSAATLELGESVVIPMHENRFSHARHLIDGLAIQVAPKPVVTATSVLIESEDFVRLNRLAIQVHEANKRWAFATLESLPRDLLSDRAGLKGLGPMTIFIPSWENLDEKMKQDVQAYLSIQPGAEMPQLVMGCRKVSNVAAAILPFLDVIDSSDAQLPRPSTEAQMQAKVIDFQRRGLVTAEHLDHSTVH